MPTALRKDPADLGRQRCRQKFIRQFPKGFKDEKYLRLERSAKVEAITDFKSSLEMVRYTQLLQQKNYREITSTLLRIEGDAQLLTSQESSNLRKVLSSPDAAKAFSVGLYDCIYLNRSLEERFENYAQMFRELNSNVSTWTIMTALLFIGNPNEHMFLKPKVTQAAADKYVFPFYFNPMPNWKTYASLLDFARQVAEDISDLNPSDNIDLQSFIAIISGEE